MDWRRFEECKHMWYFNGEEVVCTKCPQKDNIDPTDKLFA